MGTGEESQVQFLLLLCSAPCLSYSSCFQYDMHSGYPYGHLSTSVLTCYYFEINRTTCKGSKIHASGLISGFLSVLFV